MPDWFIPNLANWASLWNLKKRWNFETDFTALLRVCKNVFVIGNVKHIFLLGFASLIDFVKNESQRKVSAANGKVLASHTAVCHRWRYSTCRRGWIAGPEGALRPRHQGCEKDFYPVCSSDRRGSLRHHVSQDRHFLHFSLRPTKAKESPSSQSWFIT